MYIYLCVIIVDVWPKYVCDPSVSVCVATVCLWLKCVYVCMSHVCVCVWLKCVYVYTQFWPKCVVCI